MHTRAQCFCAMTRECQAGLRKPIDEGMHAEFLHNNWAESMVWVLWRVLHADLKTMHN